MKYIYDDIHIILLQGIYFLTYFNLFMKNISIYYLKVKLRKRQNFYYVIVKHKISKISNSIIIEKSPTYT